MSQELEVSKKQDLEVMPAWMTEYSGEGKEDIDSEALSQSIIKIIQKSSKEFDDGEAAIGDLVDPSTNENFGDKISFVVVKIEKAWRLFNDSHKLEKWSDDGIAWNDGVRLSEEETWKNKSLDFFVLLTSDEDEEMTVESLPRIITFKGTSFKAGKNLNTTLAKRISKGEPIFLRKYELSTEEQKNEKGKFAVAKVKMLQGFVSEDIAKQAKSIRAMVKNVKAKNEAQDGDSEQVDLD